MAARPICQGCGGCGRPGVRICGRRDSACWREGGFDGHSAVETSVGRQNACNLRCKAVPHRRLSRSIWPRTVLLARLGATAGSTAADALWSGLYPIENRQWVQYFSIGCAMGRMLLMLLASNGLRLPGCCPRCDAGRRSGPGAKWKGAGRSTAKRTGRATFFLTRSRFSYSEPKSASSGRR